jgi:hypothetical protein
MSWLRWLAGPEPRSAEEEVASFQQGLEEKYGAERTPVLLRMSAGDALLRARTQHRVLVVVLVSDMHQDTGEFLSSVLCTAEVRGALSGRFLVWGCSVQSACGLEAASMFSVESFPFVGAFMGMPGRNDVFRVGMLGRSTGRAGERVGFVSGERLPSADAFSSWRPLASAADVADFLGRVSSATRDFLDAQSAEAVARSAEREMVQEQDKAYREALEADRAKDRKKAEEAERRELEEALAMSIGEAARMDLDEARARLAKHPEPASGAAAAPTAALRLVFPDGSRVERVFLAQEPLSLVADYALVTAHDAGIADSLGADIQLQSLRPAVRVVSTPAARADPHAQSDPVLARSLRDLGLAPRAQLIVCRPASTATGVGASTGARTGAGAGVATAAVAAAATAPPTHRPISSSSSSSSAAAAAPPSASAPRAAAPEDEDALQRAQPPAAGDEDDASRRSAGDIAREVWASRYARRRQT